MYLTGAGTGAQLTDGPLRGEKPGNVWNPPKAGGNRIPCGGKGNTKYITTRMSVIAGQNFAAVVVVLVLSPLLFFSCLFWYVVRPF